tara:strand:- start:58 stop:819 length:762 start_codon:yes stop_codon:yes gene_type:complete
MNDLISVLIPYYKKRKFFISTIDSILKQTYKNIEIIIIFDDIDKFDLSFIKDICLKDRRIKLIINKKNIGAGFSRNKGIKKSKGKYLAFIDADDIWKKNKLQTQYEFMKNKNISFSHTSYNLIDVYGKIFGKMRVKNELTFVDLIKSCDIALSSVMIEKKILGKHKFSSKKTKEDYSLWLNLSKNYKVYGIKKYLTSWRKTPNSLSSNFIQKIMDSYYIYRKQLKNNFFLSWIYVFRLSLNFLFKKYNQVKNI